MGVIWLSMGAAGWAGVGAIGAVAEGAAGLGAATGGLLGQGGIGVEAHPASRAAIAKSANLPCAGTEAFKPFFERNVVKGVVMLDTYLMSLECKGVQNAR